MVFVPPWSIVHSRVYKAQLPYFSERFRCVTYDGRGNGKSDRPAALLPLLEEVAVLPDDESHRQEIRNILKLRKENAKLRTLAVKLSNLLGDLPVRKWEDAVAHAYGPPMR